MAHANRVHRVVGVFLALSYGLGSIGGGIMEYRDHYFSERFELPPELLYVTFAVQALCAVGVLAPRFARLAALCLTATSVGAIVAHFRIGSPATSIAGFVFTAIQLWYWYFTGRPNQDTQDAV